MQVTIELPEKIAEHLGSKTEISRQVLEAYAAEAYRTEKLSRYQVGQLLELDRWQTEEFLAKHNAQRPYTLADWEIDRQSLRKLAAK